MKSSPQVVLYYSNHRRSKIKKNSNFSIDDNWNNKWYGPIYRLTVVMENSRYKFSVYTRSPKNEVRKNEGIERNIIIQLDDIKKTWPAFKYLLQTIRKKETKLFGPEKKLFER